MAARPIDIARWYNDERFYPDVDVKFTEEEGIRETVKVHRLVICNANCFLARKLEIDDASKSEVQIHSQGAAVTIIIRSFYGFPLPPAEELSCKDWFDVALCAAGCHEWEIQNQAKQNFLDLAFEQTDAYEILDTVYWAESGCVSAWEQTLDMERFREGLSMQVRRHRCHKLIPDEHYRQLLVYNPELMLQHLDDLVAAAKDDASHS